MEPTLNKPKANTVDPPPAVLSWFIILEVSILNAIEEIRVVELKGAFLNVNTLLTGCELWTWGFRLRRRHTLCVPTDSFSVRSFSLGITGASVAHSGTARASLLSSRIDARRRSNARWRWTEIAALRLLAVEGKRCLP